MPVFSRVEMDRRHEALRRSMREAGLDAVLATSYPNFYYLSGAPVHPFGRPIACLLPAGGEPLTITSIIERGHMLHQTWIQDVRNYWDFNPTPSLDDPRPPLASLTQHLVQAVKDRDLGRARIGFEEGTLPVGHLATFREALPDVQFVAATALMDRRRLVKSPEELAFVRAGDDVSDFGQELALEIVRPGKHAPELNNTIRTEMANYAHRKYPDMPFNVHAHVGLSTLAKEAGHSEWTSWGLDLVVQPGQILEMILECWMWGYWGNVERAVSVGEPTKRQRELLEIMVELNEAAIAAIRPGITFGDVDRASKRILQKHDMVTPTGTGVGRGLTSYEGNARELLADVRLYNDVALEPGMTFTVEPHVREDGVIYRHCNTVIVTAGGCEVDSRIPRGILTV